MTENKRFRLGYVCGDYGLIDNDDWIDLHSMSENSEKNVQICINKMNELADENEQLKQEVTHWKKILDNRQQIVAKTLREQYHWLKNEDKISNHDKTVALLEIEYISARLGIDLN